MGCLQAVSLDLPDPEPNRTVVLILNPESDTPRAAGFRADEPIELSVFGDASFVALYYRTEADELQLGPGELVLLPSSPGCPPEAPESATCGRPLPPAEQVYTRAATADRFEPASAPELESLRSIRLKNFDHDLCVLQGGCVSLEYAQCNPDCSNEQPAVANLPRLQCPPGWTSQDPADCLPPSLELSLCDGPAGCALQRCPSPGSIWPTEFPPNSLFVQAGASGGTGTQQRPLGTIDAAIARGGTSIVLSAGTHEAPSAPLGASLSLRGACAAQTLIESQSAHVFHQSSGRLELAGLRLGGGSDSALLAQSATVSMVGVSIDGEGALAIEALENSVVRFERGTIDARSERAFRAQGGRLTVAESEINGGGGDCLFAELTMERVLFTRTEREQNGSAISASGCTLAVQHTHFQELNRTVFNIRSATSADLKDILIYEPDGDGIDAKGGEVHFERFVVQAPSSRGINVSQTALIRGSQFFARDCGAQALNIRDGGSDIEILGAYLNGGTFRGAVELGSEGGFGSSLRLEDLIIKGTEKIEEISPFQAELLLVSGDAHIERALVFDTKVPGVRSRQAKVTLIDLTLRDHRNLGITVEETIHDRKLERITVERSQDTGLVLRGQARRDEVKDLRISAAPGCERCQTGVLISENSNALLERVLVDGFMQAVQQPCPTQAQLRSADLRATEVGIAFNDQDFSGRFLKDVRLVAPIPIQRRFDSCADN